jgi:uncharacterized protein (DUF2249 family)
LRDIVSKLRGGKLTAGSVYQVTLNGTPRTLCYLLKNNFCQDFGISVYYF